MIKLYNTEGIPTYSLLDISNFSIKSEYDGNKVLSFDISPKHELYQYINEEIKLEYNNLIYNVKSINERSKTSTIECELDLDDLLENANFTYQQDTVVLKDILDDILTSIGWTSSGAELVTIKRSLDLKDVNTLDILNECSNIYGIVFNFDNKNKIVTVIKPDVIQPKGVYFTDELNLSEVNFRGNSSEFYTRIIPVGKDGITIEDINDGLNYIDNNDYSNKVIAKIWRDERYEDLQTLKNDAIEKLKVAAIPKRSYECKVVDLAKVNPDYTELSFSMYDIVTLIDRQRNTKINHRIVEYQEYPMEGQKNVVTLSTVPATIKGTIKRIDTLENTSDINNYQIDVNKTVVNQIRQDVDTNTALIEERYTKGETDTLIDSMIQQSSDTIRTEISGTYATNDSVTTQVTELQQSLTDFKLQVKNTGYKNYVLNSAAQNDLNLWTTTGTVSAIKNTDVNANTASGSAFSLSVNSSIEQQLSILNNKIFTISFLFRSETSAGNISVKLKQLDIENEIYLSNNTGTDWVYVTKAFTSNDTLLTLNISTTVGITLSDIIISEGEQPVTWVQSNEELYTTNVTIDATGIEIGKNTSDIHTHISNNEFTISRGTTENINISPDGTELQKTIIKDDLTIGTVKSIVRPNGIDFVVL